MPLNQNDKEEIARDLGDRLSGARNAINRVKQVGKIFVPKINKQLVENYYYRPTRIGMLPQNNSNLRKASAPNLSKLRKRTSLGNFKGYNNRGF